MRLRSKILLILSFVLITLFAVIYYLVQAFLIKDIILLENRLAGNDIKRLNQIIETRIDNISEKSGDWAMWNDAYNFMDNFKQDFVDANFTKEVFSNVKLNLIAFLKINGDVYYGKFFDSEKNQVIEIPDDFKKFLDEMKKFNNQILENGFLNGLAVVKNNSMMFSLKPVLTSEGTGPAKGILIFGKNIDKQELSTFSKNLNFNVNLVEPEKTELLIKEHNIKSTFVKIKNSDFLTCFLTKHDVFDNKNILFDFEIQREVYNSEINNIAIIFLTLLLLIFLIILLLYYLLSKLVIIKLTDLIRQITNIKEKNDLTLRLPEYGNDEITKLASEINEMLASLESSEKIVKENQIWFKTIFETVQTGVVLVEKNTHKIIDANPVAVKMIGTEKENIVGHICHKFICPADFGKCPVTDLHMEIDNSERELITDKNEKIPILKTVVSINLGNKDYLLETFSDITKLKNAEASMKAAKESAEEANIAKSRFLANMSHEIRTPLNSIIGFTEILMEEQLSLDQREHINLIHSSSETLMNLINDILDISKIEANKIEFEEIEFDLDKIIYETIDIFRSKLNQKPIEFIFNTEEIENLLIGDPVRIKQILMNLLSNAIKFTEKGEIELSLKKISESSEILNIEIAVRDTGIGIPEDKLNLIFEPFKQVDSSTTRKFGGTGLGLNIVKKIIEFMKGKIILESRLNEGSKFVITLPMKKSERNILNSVQYAEGLIGLEIVCVDDNKSNRIILENMLKKMGVIPSLFESAKKMIEYLESIDCLPKVAVIDIMMPEMDGYKVAAEIRKKYGNKIKLIGLSSQGNILETDDPAEILFDGFLNKPIKKIVLINAIKLCLYGEGDKPAGIITEQYIDQNSINKKINILVAEDIQANRKFIDVLLKKMGLSADFAENGIQAVDMASKKKYDIIFMDIQMPEMDGIEASKRIRMKEVETPIIALTANAMKGDKEICLQSGMNDYMTKPIKKDVFYKMLSKWTNIVPDYMKPQRVLIIENNSVLINILKFAILDAYPEISVKTAENGLTGASMISGFLPDIVISGSSVSGMNNDELITLINSDKRFENISIIICSDLANKNNDSYKKLSENYFVELLIPPFNRNEIVRTVNKVLKKKFFKTNGIQIGKDEEKTIEIESQENEKMFERWMKTAGGDPDFEQIIIDFLMEIPKYIEQLEKLIAQKDLDEIKKIAHSMKGSSGTMGAKELYEQFLKIDMECKTSKSIDKIAESLQEIKKVMNMIPKKYFQ